MNKEQKRQYAMIQSNRSKIKKIKGIIDDKKISIETLINQQDKESCKDTKRILKDMIWEKNQEYIMWEKELKKQNIILDKQLTDYDNQTIFEHGAKWWL